MGGVRADQANTQAAQGLADDGVGVDEDDCDDDGEDGEDGDNGDNDDGDEFIAIVAS